MLNEAQGLGKYTSSPASSYREENPVAVTFRNSYAMGLFCLILPFRTFGRIIRSARISLARHMEPPAPSLHCAEEAARLIAHRHPYFVGDIPPSQTLPPTLPKTVEAGRNFTLKFGTGGPHTNISHVAQSPDGSFPRDELILDFSRNYPNSDPPPARL